MAVSHWSRVIIFYGVAWVLVSNQIIMEINITNFFSNNLKKLSLWIAQQRKDDSFNLWGVKHEYQSIYKISSLEVCHDNYFHIVQDVNVLTISVRPLAFHTVKVRKSLEFMTSILQPCTHCNGLQFDKNLKCLSCLVWLEMIVHYFRRGQGNNEPCSTAPPKHSKHNHMKQIREEK